MIDWVLKVVFQTLELIFVFIFESVLKCFDTVNNFVLYPVGDENMLPTLKSGDYVIVHKTVHFYDYGDLIKCNDWVSLVRIYALPGDTITGNYKEVCINKQPVPCKQIPSSVMEYGRYSYKKFEEILPNEKKVIVLRCISPQKRALNKYENQDDKPEEYFYGLGDFREPFSGSTPIRIEKENIQGKVVKVLKERRDGYFYPIWWAFMEYALFDYKEDIK